MTVFDPRHRADGKRPAELSAALIVAGGVAAIFVAAAMTVVAHGVVVYMDRQTVLQAVQRDNARIAAFGQRYVPYSYGG